MIRKTRLLWDVNKFEDFRYDKWRVARSEMQAVKNPKLWVVAEIKECSKLVLTD